MKNSTLNDKYSSRKHSVSLIWSTLIVALTLAACGGSDEETSSSSSSTSVAEDDAAGSDDESAAAETGGVDAGGIDFGDDSGDWANDGECDDPRFEGEGMTSTPLLDEDILADATDCRTAFEQGTITIRSDSSAVSAEDDAAGSDDESAAAETGGVDAGGIDFGDDSGDWANDGECDDPRFEGEGMTSTPLLDEDTLADATDCRAAFEQGTITLVDS